MTSARVAPADSSTHLHSEEFAGQTWENLARLSKSASFRLLNGDQRIPHSLPAEVGGLSGPGCCVSFSADGTRMAVGDMGTQKGRARQTEAANACLTIWSLVDAVPQRSPVTRQVKSKVEAIAFSPDGRFLASGPGAEISSKRTRAVVIWSEVQPGQFAADGSIIGMSWEVLWEFDIDITHESSHRNCSLTFWESARYLTIGVWQSNAKLSDCKCGRVELWDVEAQARYRSAVHGCPAVKDFLDPPRTLESFAYSPDYKQMVVGTTARDSSRSMGYVSILPIDPHHWHNAPEVWLMCNNAVNVTHAISDVAWSAEGHWLGAGCYDEVNVWNAPKTFADCEPKAPPTWSLELSDGIGQIAFSPDGHSLAAGGAHDGLLVLWDVETGALARQWHCRRNIRAIAFAPNAAMIAAAAGDARDLLFFSLDESIYERVCVPPTPTASLPAMSGKSCPYQIPFGVLSADGGFLAVATLTSPDEVTPWQGSVTVFNLSGVKDTPSDTILTWHDGAFKALDVCSCPAAAGRERRAPLRSTVQVPHMELPQRRQLVGLLTSTRLHIWNLQTRAELQGLPAISNASHVAFSHDARVALVVGTEAEADSRHNLGDIVRDTIGATGTRVMRRLHINRIKFSAFLIETLPEEVQEHIGVRSGFMEFKLDGEGTSVRVPQIHDESLHICGPVLALTFIDEGPADPHEDVRHVVIAVPSEIMILRLSLTTWTWDTTKFPVLRSSTEQPVELSTIAAEINTRMAASAMMIAGYGADKLFLWKVDANGEAFRIMALNVSLTDEVDSLVNTGRVVRTKRSDARGRGSGAPLEGPRCRLRFGPLGNSLTLATGQRLIVWEELQPGAPWSMIHDIRFSGQVWDCNYDQRQVALKPRGVVVYTNKLAEPSPSHRTEAPIFLVYDLFEYSLSFHLPDLRLLVQQCGPSGLEGRLAACPSLLTQRLYPQELGWTLYHWAAFEGNLHVVRALCKEFKEHIDCGSPFALDLYKQNALDYALRGRHFGIIDEFLQAAVQEPKMLSNLLPDSHLALTKTVVKLLRHPVPMLARFLDSACLLKPQMLNGELPQKAADFDSNPIRTTQVHMPMVTYDDVQPIAPSGDFEQPIHIRILCLRGALDKDIGLVKALCNTPNDEVLATQTAKIYLMHKWMGRGRSGFFVELFCYIVYLALFTTWTFYFRESAPKQEDSWEIRPIFTSKDRENPWLISIQVVMFVMSLYFAYIEVSHLARETVHAEDEDEDVAPRSRTHASSVCRKCFIGFKAYLWDPWNWADIFRLLSVFYILIWDIRANNEVVGIAALFMWLRLMHYCRGFEKTGALVRSLVETLYDMKAFLLLCAIFWFAFSHCFYIFFRVDNFLQVPGGEGTVLDALVFCYRLVFLGESDIGVEERTPLVQLLFLVSTFISSVVALNMLIAIMGDTYNSVQDDAIVARHRELSHLVYEFETLQRSKEKGQRDYLLAAFRKWDRLSQDVNMSELSMDQLRNNQRTLEKELRRQDHLILQQLSRRMSNIEQMLQVRSEESDQFQRSLQQVQEQVGQTSAVQNEIWRRLQFDLEGSPPSPGGDSGVDRQRPFPAVGARSAPLLTTRSTTSRGLEAQAAIEDPSRHSPAPTEPGIDIHVPVNAPCNEP